MPRTSRIIIPGIAHHIVQRGNNRQVILEEDQDFRNYCYWINQYALQYRTSILAYCLMSNHVHLIVIPESREGIADLFRTAHMRYAQYMNKKRQTSGHLWQGRFYSCVLDEAHLYSAIRYVEQNPMRAGMVKYPWDYEWSSAKWHINNPGEKYIRLKENPVVDGVDWRGLLSNRDEHFDEVVRKKTSKGKVLARDDFIEHWERRLNCNLRELKRGPKK